MSSPRGDGDAPHDVPASPSPSARVRLEVEILASGHPVLAPVTYVGAESARRIILVCAAEADVRQYLNECLREHADVRIVAASTVPGAIALARAYPPRLLIVDFASVALASVLSDVRGILLADEVLQQSAQAESLTILARPFSAMSLSLAVDRLLA